jgi:DNA-binding IclR family transcriptional regulator
MARQRQLGIVEEAVAVPPSSAPSVQPVGDDARAHLRRAFRALEEACITPRSASEMARILNVNRSTALRMLNELVDIGVLRRDDEKRYQGVTEWFAALGAVQGEARNWSERIRPALFRIRARFGEAANFSVPASGLMVYMAYVPGAHVLGVRERVGSVKPMHASAIGKAYLAALDEGEREREVRRLTFVGGTAEAPHSEAELKERLAIVRNDGYAVDLEETIPGVACVAVAVSVGPSVVGAAGVSAPVSRLGASVIAECGRYLAAAFARPLDAPGS